MTGCTGLKGWKWNSPNNFYCKSTLQNLIEICWDVEMKQVEKQMDGHTNMTTPFCFSSCKESKIVCSYMLCMYYEVGFTVLWFVVRHAELRTGLSLWYFQVTSSKRHSSNGVAMCLAHCKRGVLVPGRTGRASPYLKCRGFRQIVGVTSQ